MRHTVPHVASHPLDPRRCRHPGGSRRGRAVRLHPFLQPGSGGADPAGRLRLRDRGLRQLVDGQRDLDDHVGLGRRLPGQRSPACPENQAIGRAHRRKGPPPPPRTATAATFSVPMDTIHSDKSQRDAQFDGRIMNVSEYPTGTFTLTAPITLKGDSEESYTAHGNLTLQGATKAVTFPLQAELKNGQIELLGDIPVLFSDYNIANPSFAGFVTTQNHGILEFLLILKQG